MKRLRMIGYGFLWLEPLWVALLAPSLLLRDLLWDPWVHPWLILALFAFWPFRLLFTGRLAPTTPVTWPAFCLLFFIFSEELARSKPADLFNTDETITPNVFAGTLLLMFLHSIVDAATWGTKLAFFSWLLLALAGALYLHEHDLAHEPAF